MKKSNAKKLRVAVFAILVLFFIFLTNTERKPNDVAQRKEYQMQQLSGYHAADLYAFYLGTENGKTISPKLHINFYDNLKRLWGFKVARSPGNQVITKVRDTILKRYQYGKITCISLKEYLYLINQEMHEVRSSINWNEVARVKGLSPKELVLVKKLSLFISARDLAAYMLTELMPGSDGEFNARLADFLLRNGGREYIESIPAIYDSKTSFGPFQFTEFALYDTGKEIRGASSINRTLETDRIPGSISKLNGNDHLKAAYLFAISNICSLVKRLSAKQFSLLEKTYETRRVDLTMYIACAHHLPANAIRSAQRWLDHDTKQNYYVSCDSKIRTYAIKTGLNLRALQKY